MKTIAGHGNPCGPGSLRCIQSLRWNPETPSDSRGAPVCLVVAVCGSRSVQTLRLPGTPVHGPECANAWWSVGGGQAMAGAPPRRPDLRKSVPAESAAGVEAPRVGGFSQPVCHRICSPKRDGSWMIPMPQRGGSASVWTALSLQAASAPPVRPAAFLRR